jgi:hypothetical protein
MLLAQRRAHSLEPLLVLDIQAEIETQSTT